MFVAAALGSYLWVLQPVKVGVQVELDSLAGARQCHATNQQHDEHDKRKRGCDVDHLGGITAIIPEFQPCERRKSRRINVQ